jgi:AmmeMemoRadiSam system protein B
MCGYAPAIAMMAYAKARGARSARLVRHATSADAGGDRNRVVGYAGMVVPL